MRNAFALIVLGIFVAAGNASAQQERPRYFLAEKVSASAPLPHKSYASTLVEVFDRVSQHSTVSARLLYSPDRQFNAYAFMNDGNAYVAFFAPLLAAYRNDKDAIAYVVAHELAHHEQGHTTKGVNDRVAISALTSLLGAFVDYNLEKKSSRNAGVGKVAGQVAGTALVSSYTRDQEREADQVGLQMMARAGFDPRGAVRAQKVMLRLSKESWFTLFDSHPSHPERIDNLEIQIKTDPVVIAAVSSRQSAMEPLLNKSLASAATPDGVNSNHSGSEAIARIRDSIAEANRLTKAGDNKAGSDKIASEFDNALQNASQAKSDLDRILLARVLLSGKKGNTEGPKLALQLLMDVADKSSANVKYMIGAAYYLGGRGDQGKQQSGMWLREASDLGYPQAQYALGTLYESGAGGVPQNQDEAIRWYRLAAEKDYKPAMQKLERLRR